MSETSRRAFLASLAAIAGATTLPVAAIAAVIEPKQPDEAEQQLDNAEQQVDDDELSSQWGHRRRVVRRVYRRGYRRGYYGSVYRHRRRVVRRAYRRRW
jgi:SOS response regulatory protein OraA/RecX